MFMKYEDFKEVFFEKVSELMKEKHNMELELSTSFAVNMEVDNIRIHLDENGASPSLRLHPCYEAFCGGQNMRTLVNNVVCNLYEAYVNRPSHEQVTDFSNFKEQIFLQLINADKNQKLLETVPHLVIGEFAAIVRWQCVEEGSAIVYKNLLSKIDMTEEELLDIAKANTLRIETPQIIPMNSMIAELMDEECCEDVMEQLMSQHPMLIITNSSRVYGASMILFDEVLKRAYDIMGENYFILPSSIHECIIIRESQGEYEQLKWMVRDVNQTQLAPEDFLSNEVYHYSKEVGLTCNDELLNGWLSEKSSIA